MKYFILNPEFYFVSGAKRGAIYDLKNGRLFWVDDELANLLRMCENRLPLKTIVEDFPDSNKVKQVLTKLEQDNFGQFYEGETCPIVEKIKPPITKPELSIIFMELTTRCNWDCIFCEEKTHLVRRSKGCKRWPVKGKEISSSQWCKIMDQAYALGARFLEIHGGEPFLRPKVMKIILSHAQQLGFQTISIWTNGDCLLENRYLFKVLTNKRVFLNFQVYSTREDIFNEISGVNNRLQKLKKILDCINQEGIRHRIMIPILKQNEDHIDDIYSWCLSFRPEQISTEVVRPLKGQNNDCISFDSLHRLGNNNKTFNNNVTERSLIEPLFSSVHDDITRQNFIHTFFRFSQGHPCFNGALGITSTGYILPCLKARNSQIGYIKETELKDLFTDNPRIESFWTLTKDRISECKDCEFRYACLDCRPLAESATGDFYSKDPLCLYDPYAGKCKPIDDMNFNLLNTFT